MLSFYGQGDRDKEWLGTVNQGDTVFVSSRNSISLVKVTRITPTQIVVGEMRFNKRTGYRVGSSGYDAVSLERATPERIEQYHLRRARARMLRQIRDMANNLSLDSATPDNAALAEVVRLLTPP